MTETERDIEALARLFKKLKKKKKLKRIGTHRNPKKAGSAPRARWDLLFRSAKQGASVWDYISANGRPDTLKNAITQGYIELV